jgi:hypothetical protein
VSGIVRGRWCEVGRCKQASWAGTMPCLFGRSNEVVVVVVWRGILRSGRIDAPTCIVDLNTTGHIQLSAVRRRYVSGIRICVSAAQKDMCVAQTAPHLASVDRSHRESRKRVSSARSSAADISGTPKSLSPMSPSDGFGGRNGLLYGDPSGRSNRRGSSRLGGRGPSMRT